MGKILKVRDESGIIYPVTLDEAVVYTGDALAKSLKDKLGDFATKEELLEVEKVTAEALHDLNNRIPTKVSQLEQDVETTPYVDVENNTIVFGNIDNYFAFKTNGSTDGVPTTLSQEVLIDKILNGDE